MKWEVNLKRYTEWNPQESLHSRNQHTPSKISKLRAYDKNPKVNIFLKFQIDSYMPYNFLKLDPKHKILRELGFWGKKNKLDL